MTKREAGARGGAQTFRKYGAGHMAEIGRKGARVFHSRYHLLPVGLNNFFIISRETGEFKAALFYNSLISPQVREAYKNDNRNSPL